MSTKRNAPAENTCDPVETTREERATKRNASAENTCDPTSPHSNGTPAGTDAPAGNDVSGSNDAISKRCWILLLALCIASLAGHLLVMPYLPARIPIHWDLSGNVDGWGGPWDQLLLNALPLLMLAVFYVSPRIDPRGASYRRFSHLWRGFVIALTLFMIAVSWGAEATVFGLFPQGGSMLGNLIMVALGAGLIALGNYLPRVRSNYTFGCKTPWALHNERNWMLTHRVAGRTFMVAGALIMAFPLAAPALGDAASGVLIATIIGASIVPYLYSYLVFRHGNRPLRG